MKIRRMWLGLSALLALACTTAVSAQTVVSKADASADTALAGSFIAAGGGAGSFSVVRAFQSMIGPERLSAEQRTLAAQFGQDAADDFVHIFDYAMSDAWARAGQANLSIPQYGSDGGQALALELRRAGQTGGYQFSTPEFFDRILGLRVANAVMADMLAEYGGSRTASFMAVAGRFFSDLSQQTG